MASPLEATADAGHTLFWYLNPGGASSTTPFTPSTSTAGTTTYYVSQKGPGGCESELAAIEVVVLEETTPGAIQGNQTICRDTQPAEISTTTVGTGVGTISYRWESSIDEGTTWVSISGVSTPSYQPPVLQEATWYRRITIASDHTQCESEPTNEVKINVKNCKLITNPHIYNKVINGN